MAHGDEPGENVVIRTFVAVELDGALKERLARLQDGIRNRLRRDLPPDARLQWVRPESIHLTFKFLGEIPEDRVEEIRQALEPVANRSPGFSVEVGGIGVFPEQRAPRVLWIGLADPGGRLTHLAGEIDRALERIGFSPEARAFSPHLTLGRIKERAREIGRVLASAGVLTQTEPLGSLAVQRVALMKSELKPSGAVYTRLWEASLGKAEA
jgi:2'-5' RNA ligase